MLTTIEFQNKFNEIEDLLFGFAMKLTRNRDAAKDLMQEVLYRAYKNIDSYSAGTNFKAWMSTIMRNTYINAYRKQKTRSHVMAPVEDFMFASKNKMAEGSAEGKIMLKELYGMINSLSDAYREPFKLFIQGYQYQEISERFDIPIGTVKRRINYARKKLKTSIVGNYGAEVRRA